MVNYFIALCTLIISLLIFTFIAAAGKHCFYSSFVIYKIKTTLKQIAADCYTVYALRFIISVSRWRSEKTVSHLDLGERLLMEVIHFSNGSSLCFISFVPHVFSHLSKMHV